jgi:hypothetical protein
VAYSVYMLGDIAGNFKGAVDAADLRLARCMLEAFYVHLRLLAEFLVKPTQGRDFGPSDFDVTWTVPDLPEAIRLTEHWQVASSYVLHFGRSRVPEDVEDLEPFLLGEDVFLAMAGDALAVFSIFLDRLAESSAWKGGSLIPDPESDPGAWQSRLQAEQANILRTAFTQSHAQITE